MGRRLRNNPVLTLGVVLSIFTVLFLIVAAGCSVGLMEEIQDKVEEDFINDGTIPTYTVTYSGNEYDGGIVPADNSRYKEGESLIIAGAGTMTRTGYAFTGWNTAIDGSGDSHIAGDTFTMPTHGITLYAQWTANDYTITFDINDVGATGTMPVQTITYGLSANLTDCSFTKTDWTFLGWATTPGGGVSYSDGESYLMGTSNVTLYAQWTNLLTFTVTFTSYGGSTVVNQTIIDGHTVSEPTAPSRTGYTFSGWFEESSYSTPWDFDNNQIFADDELHAKWTANTYTITFNANGGTSASPSSKPVIYGSDYGELAETSRIGYKFNGWWTSSSGGTPISISTEVTIAGNDTLYAHWNIIASPRYGVTLNTLTAGWYNDDRQYIAFDLSGTINFDTGGPGITDSTGVFWSEGVADTNPYPVNADNQTIKTIDKPLEFTFSGVTTSNVSQMFLELDCDVNGEWGLWPFIVVTPMDDGDPVDIMISLNDIQTGSFTDHRVYNARHCVWIKYTITDLNQY